MITQVESSRLHLGTFNQSQLTADVKRSHWFPVIEDHSIFSSLETTYDIEYTWPLIVFLIEWRSLLLQIGWPLDILTLFLCSRIWAHGRFSSRNSLTILHSELVCWTLILTHRAKLNWPFILTVSLKQSIVGLEP